MTDNDKNKLAKPKNVFSNELQNRIQIGNELLKRQVSTVEEIEELTLDFSSWDDINRELIKYAFQKPDNEHFKKYESLNSYIAIEEVL